MDQIIIQDLSVYAKHGVHVEENILGQQFLVSVYIDMNLSKAGQTDNLEDTADYGAICHFVTKYMQEHTFKLIEAAAEHLAQELLMRYARIEKIKIILKKPWAPIGLPIKNVSVSVERMRHSAFLSLGSNLGDKQAYIRHGIAALKDLASCKVCAVSKLIETEPYGGVQQDSFLNCAVQIETVLSPCRLLETLHEIEKQAGRTRELRWGPRTLDMDIVFYDHEVINTPHLTIPHIDMHNRMFVLEPLNEIAPWYVHPVLKKSVQQLYDRLVKENA